MLRRFFRIGFGGCGCAMVVHFIERVNVIYRGILLKDYKKLARWENGLANESRLRMRAKLKELRERIFAQEREATYSLNEVEKYIKLDKYLDAWDDSLDELLANTPWMSYERDIVEEIKRINRTMDRKAEAMKGKEEAVLLEGLMVDSFSGTSSATGGADKARFLYNTMIKKTRPLIVNKYDKDILDSEGFDHHPELQMLPFSMKEVRYEVYEVISKAAEETKKGKEGEEGTKIGSRGNFFFVGLGGGTGTGVISPLAEQFGKGSRGYFTLGLLGGKDDNEYLGSQQPWFRRCFNILLALNDLIATADLDGIILVDNEVLMDRLEARGKLEKHEAVSSDRKDFIKFLKDEFGMDWVENAEIVRGKFESDGNKIYHIYDANENFAEIKIDNAGQSAILKISDGRIYNLKIDAGKIHGRAYAEKIDEELTKIIYPAFGITACEESGTDIDWAQLKHRMYSEKQEQGSPIFVPCYASDKNKTTAELIKEALDNGKLAKCECKNADKIIGYVRDIRNEDDIKAILSDKFKTNTEEIKIIKRAAEKADVLTGVSKKIIVFESKTSKEEGEEESYLFTIDAELEADLDTEYTSEKLKNAFKTKKGITLHENVNLKKVEDKVWEIIDKGKNHSYIYKIKKEDDKLNIYEEIKENEVLLLLRNCNVKDTLHNRLKEAQSFVDLLDVFKELIEEEKRKSSLSTEEIARGIIDNERDKLIDFIEVCLFSWEDIPEKVSGTLSNFLCVYLNLKWAENAEISKVDGNTISISKDGNSSEITIDEDKKKAILKFSDGKTHDLKLKNDNGKLNVYKELISTAGIEAEYLFSWDKVQDDKEEAKKGDKEKAKNKLMWSLRHVFNIDWVENATITKSDDDRVITVSKIDHKAEIILADNKETATLKIGGKTYNLKIEENGEQKVYESENRASEKILQEAKSFLLPMDIGPQKMEETYERMTNIVGNLKKVVDVAINNLDKGIMPIFTDPIFDITSAVASDAEVILTSMLAMGEDTYSTYCDALGDDKIEDLFGDFKLKTLEEFEDQGYVENRGGADDYILKYKGEKVIVDVDALKEKLDKVSIVIKKPLDLIKVIGTEKFLEFAKKVKDNDNDINFPKLLVLSFLYTKWEYVCGWDNISGYLFSWNNVLGDDTERIMNFLKMEHHIGWAEKAKVDKLGDGKTISISKDGKSAEILIDEKNEKATLKITDGRTHELKAKKEDGKLNIYKELEDAVKEVASSLSTDGEAATVKKRYFFSWNSVSGVDVEKLKEFLEKDFNIGWVKNAEIPKFDGGKTISIFKDENSAEILIDEKKEKATLKITDVQTHELKVKNEDGKLNIYKDDNENEKIIEELCNVSNFDWVANGVVIERLDKDTVSIFNAEHLAEITICEKNENRMFKEIRAGRPLTILNIGREDLKEDAIRNELDKVPRTDGFSVPDEFKLKEEGVNKWRITDKKDNETEYYARFKNGSLRIFGKGEILGLKVKEGKAGKLKIYKKRKKQSEAITTEKSVSVNRPLDVPVSEL